MTLLFRALMQAGYTILFLALFALLLGWGYLGEGMLMMLGIAIAIAAALIGVSIYGLKQH